ncbi:hypothetical protein DIPPA_16011 [Diplonema papillatum]|nr:hypothetical protein DIPPA_16011 [Diplonema papillatum]
MINVQAPEEAAADDCMQYVPGAGRYSAAELSIAMPEESFGDFVDESDASDSQSPGNSPVRGRLMRNPAPVEINNKLPTVHPAFARS